MNLNYKSGYYEWIPYPVCDSWEVKPIFSKRYIGSIDMGQLEEFFIAQCKNCGLIYLNPRLNLSAYRRLYPNPRRVVDATPPNYFGIIKDTYLDLFMKPIIKQRPSGRILEFVCREEARKRGIEVFCGQIEEAQYPDRFFDAIYHAAYT